MNYENWLIASSVILVVLSLITYYLFNYYSTLLHENVHKIIYKEFGCTNVSVYVNCSVYGCSGVTVGNCNLTGYKKMLFNLLNTENEIVTYNVTNPILSMLSLMNIFLASYTFILLLAISSVKTNEK